jgi:hypothetical protein
MSAGARSDSGARAGPAIESASDRSASVPGAVAEAPPRAREAAPRLSPAAGGAVRFDIRRLTLSGYAEAEQRRFVRSLRTELARLSHAVPPGQWPAAGEAGSDPPPAFERLDAGEMRPGATPEEAARQIARRIVEKVARGGGARNV